MIKLCECGCGEPAPIARQAQNGYRRGESQRFIRGHAIHGRVRSRTPHWKGGRLQSHGYTLVLAPHVRANSRGYVREHILVCERVMGKPLPDGAVVHHVNGRRSDNRPCNLVVCQDPAYHALLHRRKRARDACGHADWIRCKFCKAYAPAYELYISPAGRYGYHRACAAVNDRRRRSAH